ncbi:hypothetical protein N9X60_01570 [Paracoccaceae bacterium]|nr:hypothetical protein [Paracoccaceae bacterium]
MSLGTRLSIALGKKILKLHKRHHTSNRGWAINNGFASSTPFEFDYAAYDKDSYADMWRMNIELHDAMNDYWNETVGNDAAQDAFALWVIQSWGGIRKHNEKTLNKYLYEAKNFTSMDGKEGVASYSKLMAAKDCNKNFILDARVAVALNVLQLEYFGGHRYFFDVLSTQNKEISAFNKIYKRKQYEAIGYRVFDGDMYSFFNALILKMADYLGVRGIEVEMMLFDNATNIIADLDAVAQKYEKNKEYWQWRLSDWDKRKKKRHTERLKAEGYNLA